MAENFNKEGSDSKRLEFPFTELPLEIRTRIYELLFGKRHFHVETFLHKSPDGHDRSQTEDGVTRKWITRVCSTAHAIEHDVDYFEVYAKFCQMKAGTEIISQFYHVNTHAHCKPINESQRLNWWRHNRHRETGTDSDAEVSNGNGISIALLHVCRQIYEEAIHVLYSSNCFSFSGMETFSRYVMSIPAKYTSLIRKLHLFGVQNPLECPHVEEKVFEKLSGLQELFIQVDLHSTEDSDMQVSWLHCIPGNNEITSVDEVNSTVENVPSENPGAPRGTASIDYFIELERTLLQFKQCQSLRNVKIRLVPVFDLCQAIAAYLGQSPPYDQYWKFSGIKHLGAIVAFSTNIGAKILQR